MCCDLQWKRMKAGEPRESRMTFHNEHPLIAGSHLAAQATSVMRRGRRLVMAKVGKPDTKEKPECNHNMEIKLENYVISVAYPLEKTFPVREEARSTSIYGRTIETC